MSEIRELERRFQHVFVSVGGQETSVDCTEKEYRDLASNGTPEVPRGLTWFCSSDYTVYDSPDGKFRDQDLLKFPDGSAVVMEGPVPVYVTADYEPTARGQQVVLTKPHPDLRKSVIEPKEQPAGGVLGDRAR